MAPTYSRQLLIWTIPTVILFGYLWYKRKRTDPRKSGDPGEQTSAASTTTTQLNKSYSNHQNLESLVTKEQTRRLQESSSSAGSPIKTGEQHNRKTSPPSYSRSLSGVDSAPIDIILPPELKATKSNPIIISDEDLDIEIEKIKSMRCSYGGADTADTAASAATGTDRNQSLNCCSSSSSTSPLKTQHDDQTPPIDIVEEEDEEEQSQAKVQEAEKQETVIVAPVPPVPKHDTVIVLEDRPRVVVNPKELRNKPMPTKKVSPAKKAGAGGGGKKSQKMAQEQVVVVETTSKGGAGKTTNNNNNKLTNNNHNHNSRKHDDHKQLNNDRDSANHSPADCMMASPSLSSISDNHSEGSNDSGKGGSDVLTPPPSRTPGAEVDPATLITIYEFVLPQNLVGKLIGKNGSFVAQIKEKTGAHVIVRKHPANNKMKVCCIEANQKELDSALKLIRERFPVKRFPEVTLEQVSFLTQVPLALTADHLYLKLIEGINNDTIVSCMVAPNHLFLQQPTHPSYPNLHVLNGVMNVCYSESESPLLPTPIPENTVCAALSVDSWYRAMVLSTDTETGTSYVNFLDYGGYAYVDNSKLRQIRGDFMLLPFQAAECFLANIKPVGDAGWCQEAYNLVAELTKGALNYTQIVDYTEEGIPLVHCYLVTGHQRLLFLNQEIVNQGFAEWIQDLKQPQGEVVYAKTEAEVVEEEEPVASSSQP